MNESILQAFLFLTSREIDDEQNEIYRNLGFHTTKPIQFILQQVCLPFYRDFGCSWQKEQRHPDFGPPA